jgi:hypothetical protein
LPLPIEIEPVLKILRPADMLPILKSFVPFLIVKTLPSISNLPSSGMSPVIMFPSFTYANLPFGEIAILFMMLDPENSSGNSIPFIAVLVFLNVFIPP